jgi:ribosome-associated translation inhibitor RaiA
MTYTLEFRDWTPAAEERELVEHAIARVDQLVTRLSWEPVTLRVVVERNAPRTLYHVVLTLDVSGRTLVAREERPEVSEAVREAFAGIEREILEHRERMRHANEYKRPARRAKLRDVT